MKIHELKTWPPYWEDVRNEAKSFEIRKDDRDFQKGDFLHLREYEMYRGYTGRSCYALIIYKANGFGLIAGHCVLGLLRIDNPPPSGEKDD